MHLVDSISHHPELRCVCHHHEQAAAMAAEAYARLTGEPGVVCVTSGPGAVNAINGVSGAWTDSIPMLVLSGQVKRETCRASYQCNGLRQLGYQETDVVGMVSGITKYAALVDRPESIRRQLERAWRLARTGRPGPCWLDIPLDVQGLRVPPESLEPCDSPADGTAWDRNLVAQQCREVIERLGAAERPLILAGHGIRVARAEAVFQRVAQLLGVPITTSRTARDLVSARHPLFAGRPGAYSGDRAGNFAIQNSDVLLALGTRLGVALTGYNFARFAPGAYKIQVDIDPAELNKPTLRPDLGIHCDAGAFLCEMERQLAQPCWNGERHSAWVSWCRERLKRYPVVREPHRKPGGLLNPYHFMELLLTSLAEDEVLVAANGSAASMACQIGDFHGRMRFLFNSGNLSMGYDLPAAIGAAMARPGQRVVCLAGDGSIMMNLQELQTIVHHRLPIKIFVLNNGGYLSIRTTQQTFFGRLAGESPASGISFPDFTPLAAAFGLATVTLDRAEPRRSIQAVLEHPGPVLCDVKVDPDQRLELRCSTRLAAGGRLESSGLEDLWPHLPAEDLASNLLSPALLPLPSYS